MFNKDTLKHSLLKKQTLMIISILAIGSFGIVYATGTSISDTGIITPSLTVNGNQIGEGSFSSYNTIALNTTVGGAPDTGFRNISISNTGSVLFSGDTNNYYVTVSGVTKFVNASVGIGGSKEIAQSSNGEYGVIFNDGGVTVNVFKNSAYLQVLGLNTAQFSNLFGKIGIAISPSGKYVAVVGEDSGLASDRLVIFQGT